MSRHNRLRRAQRQVAPPEPELEELAPGPAPRWLSVIFTTGALAMTALFCSLAVFLGVVQPLVAPLAFRSTEGLVIGYSGERTNTGVNWGEENSAQVIYTVDGASFRCLGSRHVSPTARPGDPVRVYYPAARPEQGFVCDWVPERRWQVSTWPLAAFSVPFLLFVLIANWVTAIMPWHDSLRQSALRSVLFPYGLWFAGLLLGGVIGILVVKPKNMDHPVPAFLLQVVCSVAGGVWALRWAGRRSAPASEGNKGNG